jgi:hypothetical protein
LDEQHGNAPVKERKGLLMVTMDDAKQRNNTTDFAVEHPARPEFIII